jgi:hypothetical protein
MWSAAKEWIRCRPYLGALKARHASVVCLAFAKAVDWPRVDEPTSWRVPVKAMIDNGAIGFATFQALAALVTPGRAGRESVARAGMRAPDISQDLWPPSMREQGTAHLSDEKVLRRGGRVRVRGHCVCIRGVFSFSLNIFTVDLNN